MLFVYLFIILCFNFININCDVRNTNLERRSRGDIISRGIKLTSVSADQVESISTTDEDLETPLPKTDDFEIKRNTTRVRKLKRRRLQANPNKVLEITSRLAYPSRKSEEDAKLTEKSIENLNVDNINLEPKNKELKRFKSRNEKKDGIILERFISRYSDTNSTKTEEIVEATEKNIEANEKKNKERNNSNGEIILEQSKIKDVAKGEQAVVENTDDRKVIAVTPRTFPKRPAEFNPVMKKKRRERDPVVRIVTEKNFVYGHNGNFHYSFEGADGTKVYSKGNLIKHQEAKAGEAVVGGYSYTDKDGNDYSLAYTADQNGYRPVGAHLPTPPPIPPAIARALEYLATKSTPAPVTEEYSEF